MILGVFLTRTHPKETPVALDESVVSELLAALRSGEGVDLVREAVRYVLQELIEAEAVELIGARRYERTDARANERNGHRRRLLSTKAGDVELGIPKLRRGSFFPSILEPRRRIDQALYAVVLEAYVNGVSTRAVDDLVAALGIDAGISRSEVSRICTGLDAQVAAFRSRRLDHLAFPYVWLDGTYLHVREDHHVVSKAVIIVTGVSAAGHREVLGMAIGDSEDEAFWRSFLRDLRARGAVRGAPCDLRSARRARRRDPPRLPGRRTPALSGPLREGPPRPRPEGPPRDGGRGVPDDLRLCDARRGRRPVGPRPLHHC